MTILITGANGQVGNEFQHIAQSSAATFLFTDYQDLDITDTAAVNTYFEKNKIDYCVNCAAYTAVDKAESEPIRAFAINVTGSKNLATACAQQGIPFVQLSTDYVYHNAQNTPFKETDITNPQGVYAQTKLDGDRVALEANPKSIVIRTSWVYSTYGHNFVKTMKKLGTDRDRLTIVFDQIGSPTYARHLANAIMDIITQIADGSKSEADYHGVFHYSNEGVCSWYDFAEAIFRIEGIDCENVPIESKDFPTPASRPPFSLLNKGKIKATFGLNIPHWRQALTECLANLKD